MVDDVVAKGVHENFDFPLVKLASHHLVLPSATVVPSSLRQLLARAILLEILGLDLLIKLDMPRLLVRAELLLEGFSLLSQTP